ncbi:MAG: hypothetical protein IPG72_09615 [Ardenticatenales bacterium]|nr:hypothetical protein [Ardenticatenales bacterium]
MAGGAVTGDGIAPQRPIRGPAWAAGATSERRADEGNAPDRRPSAWPRSRAATGTSLSGSGRSLPATARRPRRRRPFRTKRRRSHSWVRPERDGTWTLVDAADAGRRIPVAGTAHGTDRQIWTAGRTLRCGRVVAGGAARHAADAAGLSAVIPSVVLDVLVAPGEVVADGQKLILLESMKMVVAIQAPFAGVVTAVHCAKGEAVQPGVPLLALEEAPAAAP